MKRETYQNKLAALLGLEEFKVDKKTGKPIKDVKDYNKPVPISEEEISNFRAAQGVIYFLQAPELFQPRVCGHCGEPFLVSRMYVAFCSYTCIKMSLQEQGLRWEKGKDLEALARDPQVYDGNEPIWINNLDRIRGVLDAAASNSDAHTNATSGTTQ